jgi:hypothetical protein
MTLSVDGGEGVPLDNLPNTGGWDTFRWSKTTALEIPAGEHEMDWKNVRGGGIHLDAWAFSLDPDWQPDEEALPNDDENVLVWQAERFVDFDAKDGRVMGDDTAAVILTGDSASIRDLNLCGSSQTNIGIAAARLPRFVQRNRAAAKCSHGHLHSPVKNRKLGSLSCRAPWPALRHCVQRRSRRRHPPLQRIDVGPSDFFSSLL